MAWQPISDERARAMYRTGRADATARRLARLWAAVFGAGLLPRRWVTLEVPGRSTGERRRFPLGMADVGEDWYLVSMLGDCAWVRNVRAADGNVTLRRRRRRRHRLEEVPVEDRGPILRRYVEVVPGARPHVPVPVGAPAAAFQAVAARYPVFRVGPAEGRGPGRGRRLSRARERLARPARCRS